MQTRAEKIESQNKSIAKQEMLKVSTHQGRGIKKKIKLKVKENKENANFSNSDVPRHAHTQLHST